jgi:hypothetical protein
MQLPDDVLGIIRDFARPLTRPDWRSLHRLLPEQLHFNIIYTFNNTFNLALIYFIKNQTSDYVYILNEGNIVSITTPQNRRYLI